MGLRSTVRGYLKFAPETAPLGLTATDLDDMPGGLTAVGYIDMPAVRRPEGSTDIETVGSYVDPETVPGGRGPSMSVNMRVGANSASFLANGLRSAGCLAEFALRTGALDPCGAGDPFNWDVRHGLLNSLGFQFQEGQPLTCALEIPALAIAAGTILETQSLADLQAAAGPTFTFFHLDWVINGTSFRHYLQSASVQVNNNVKPVGSRNDQGWDKPLSRAPRILLPGLEKLQVSYRMFAELPGNLHDAAAQAGNWGTVIIRADNSGVATGGKVMTLTISNNMLASHDMESVQPGQPFGFSAATTSRVIAIGVS